MKLVFATHNLNKLHEVQLLMPKHITLLSLDDIGCTEEIAETANTLEGNAKIKADHVTKNYRIPCFADDTGLLVDALNGEPGVYSARYAGEQKNDNDNMNKLLEALTLAKSRAAHFKTVIALNLENKSYFFEGKVVGNITKEKLGNAGFGYDPIFMPNEYEQTFAQLSLEIKNKIGHRGKATQKLINFLKTIN